MGDTLKLAIINEENQTVFNYTANDSISRFDQANFKVSVNKTLMAGALPKFWK